MVNVLIPAFNEASTVGRAVDAVLRTGVQPLVIPNGCTDKTAEIAACHGALVLEVEHAGKMPAIQEALRHLGDAAIQEPFVTLDADSWPVFPNRWLEAMTKATERPEPTVAVGQLVQRNGAGMASNITRTTLQYARQARSIVKSTRGSWPGGNMCIRVHTPEQLDELLGIPHYWPGEDLAIHDAVVAAGGVAVKSLSPFAAVYTESRYARNFFSQLAHSRLDRTSSSVAQYEERGAEGSEPYRELAAYQWLATEATSD